MVKDKHSKLPLYVTLDAEGDNGWDRPHKITTENAKGVARFQSFCEEYGIKPIYLATYEMSMDSAFVEAVKKKNFEGSCEVGMHMHGWTTPPFKFLTNDDYKYLPYIVEFPRDVIEEKTKNLINQLTNVFETNIVSHRSGRWVVNDAYLEILLKNKIKVDCSVTPLIDWQTNSVDYEGNRVGDYSDCPSVPYEINLHHGKIMEIPMTTMKNKVYDNLLVNGIMKAMPFMKGTKVYNALNARKVVMLRPDVRKRSQIFNLISKLQNDNNVRHVEFMVHTSEIYKGTSPHCHTDEDLNAQYTLMGEIFTKLNEFCVSRTFRDTDEII